MSKSVVLYSTGCPKCKVLKKKLDNAGITYDTVSDVDEMLKLGLSSAPALGVDGEIMNFESAIKWIKDVVE
jgi:glutaredoxin